jgi:FMN phosphatase YigB (HAD superfamily)
MKGKTPRQGTAKKTKTQRVVFLLDVDNTLLDNDRVAADLRRHLKQEVGPACERQYWTIFEQLRAELGYADYLGALQRYRIEHAHDHNLLAISSFLVNYPFANRLYPNSLDVVERCQEWGTPVILSDGDVVFQPRKIERSRGLQGIHAPKTFSHTLIPDPFVQAAWISPVWS